MNATVKKVKLKNLTEEQCQKVDRVIQRVWQEIGFDIGQLEGGENLPNTAAIECCLDANRPSFSCGAEGKEVEDLLHTVDATWTGILRFFSKRNPLV